MSESYRPPSPDEMKLVMQDGVSRDYLIAQRELYARAKRSAALRIFMGFAFSSIFPIATLIWTNCASAFGAAAGGGIFLSRVFLIPREKQLFEKAAYVQEKYDRRIFKMPVITYREAFIDEAEISEISAKVKKDLVKEKATSKKKRESLEDWYIFDSDVDPQGMVCILQQGSIGYTKILLNFISKHRWQILTLWMLILGGLSLAAGLSLSDFVLGVLITSLPAMLDFDDNRRMNVKAIEGHQAIIRNMEECLKDERATQLGAEDLLSWQDEIFHLRCSSPIIPECLYFKSKDKNEANYVETIRRLVQLRKETLSRRASDE